MKTWQEFQGSDDSWDAAVLALPESGFMQTSAWAKFKEAEGYRVERMVWAGDGKIAGQTLLLAFPGEGFAVCPEGPCLSWQDEDETRLALRALADHAHGMGAIGLRIEPRLSEPAPRLLKNWSRSPVDLCPAHTLVVDLAAGEEERLSRIHPKARYNLGLARRHGVKVTESRDPAAAGAFYELFLGTASRNGFFAEPFSFFVNLAKTLVPCGRARFLFAHRSECLCSAMVLITCGGRATYLYGASSDEHRRFMSTYALHWEAMQVAARSGCSEYDLYGYDPFGHPDHLYAGISRFKRHWGGSSRSWMGARDYIFYDRVAEKVVGRLGGAALGNP